MHILKFFSSLLEIKVFLNSNEFLRERKIKSFNTTKTKLQIQATPSLVMEFPEIAKIPLP